MNASALPNGTKTASPIFGSGMPLTEYSANPTSPPPEQSQASSSVPPEFLLPDGYPDVSADTGPSRIILKATVPPTHSHLPRLRCR